MRRQIQYWRILSPLSFPKREREGERELSSTHTLMTRLATQQARRLMSSSSGLLTQLREIMFATGLLCEWHCFQRFCPVSLNQEK